GGRGGAGAGVAGVRVGRGLGCDNGDVHGFSHAARVMQLSSAPHDARPAAASAYRERMSPSLKILAGAAIVAPMVSLVFVRYDAFAALGLGVAAAVALIAALVLSAPRVVVVAGELRADRAHIDVK